MAKTRKSARLGRGLSALLNQPVPIQPIDEDAPDTDHHPPDGPADPDHPHPEADPSADASHAQPSPEPDPGQDPPALRNVPVAAIQPNRHQPRQRFDEHALEQLAQSIREAGVMQPIVVRPIDPPNPDEPAFELVAGERRWRAARIAGLDQIPALVRELSDQQLAEWALIENLQREDLNPIERAQAFSQLVEHFHLRHDDIAQRVGVDRSTVSNLLRLLTLHEPVRQLVSDGQLSAGQARALAGLDDPDQQLALARHAIAQAWSVRRIEDAVRKQNAQQTQPDSATTSRPASTVRSAQLADLERQVAEQLHTKVRIKPGRKKGTGTLTIEFYDLDHFDSLLKQLGVETE